MPLAVPWLHSHLGQERSSYISPAFPWRFCFSPAWPRTLVARGTEHTISGGGNTVPGGGGHPFHHDLPNTQLRTSPQQLSLCHSAPMVGPAAVFLPARAWPSSSEEGAGGQASKCKVYPSPRLLVLGGGGGQSLIQ